MGIRSRWYAAAAVVVGLVAVTPVIKLLSRDRPAPKVDAPPGSVRVEQELVQADVLEPVRVVTAGAATVTPSGRTVTPPRQRAMSRAAAPGAAREATLVQKAGRAFLGDGRHRPQPFPTVR